MIVDAVHVICDDCVTTLHFLDQKLLKIMGISPRGSSYFKIIFFLVFFFIRKRNTKKNINLKQL